MKRITKPSSLGQATARIPVADYGVKGADGWALKRGYTVRRPEHLSPSMGVMVSSDVGIITDLFRRTLDGPVLVDVQRDASACCGRATWPATETHRSQAHVVGWAEALGFTAANT